MKPLSHRFRFVLLLSTATALALWAGSASAIQATKVKNQPKQAVDINTASAAELQELPGIGPATADAIIAARPFASVQDLEKVRGIGPAKLAGLKGLVKVGQAPASKKEAPTKKKAAPHVPTGAVDINKASAAELEELPGIGPALAKGIIEGRPYASVEDLARVKGIGESKIEDLTDLVTVGQPARPATKAAGTAPTAKSDAARKPRGSATTPAAKPKTALGGKMINVNTATQEELESLPLIGPVKAKAIIDGRPFGSVEDLKKVKGIGEKTFERIKDLVTAK
jgi:competence protein ComEA